MGWMGVFIEDGSARYGSEAIRPHLRGKLANAATTDWTIFVTIFRTLARILQRAVICLIFVVAACQPAEVPDAKTEIPDWVAKLIATQQARLIEEQTYQGRRVFHVMPSNRGDDVGNEHVLYSQDGQIICEYGGIAGNVTVGACDIEKVKFVRTVHTQHE